MRRRLIVERRWTGLEARPHTWKVPGEWDRSCTVESLSGGSDSSAKRLRNDKEAGNNFSRNLLPVWQV
jgi:hypothetical protein